MGYQRDCSVWYTGIVAELLERRWLALEMDPSYIEASKFRFDNVKTKPSANGKKKSARVRATARASTN